MIRAVVDGTVVAESDATVVVEGNHYFPPRSVVWQHLAATDQTTLCPWKGTAGYYDVTVGDRVLTGAAWTYREPLEAAAEIADHVAFYPQITIET